jgi:hypothetical protein
MPFSLIGCLHDVYGKFRAEDFAQATCDAARRIAYLWGVIALGVEEAGHLQNATGTIGHAQLAALTSLGD